MERQLKNPPNVERLFGAQIVSCVHDDRIGDVAQQMFARSFSQLPIVVDGKIGGLLTTDAIARWVAAAFGPNMNLIEEETVQEVMRHSEDGDAYVIVPRTCLLAEIAETFSHGARDGCPLKAVIVTHSGRPTEEPLSILTGYDFPELFAMLEA